MSGKRVRLGEAESRVSLPLPRFAAELKACTLEDLQACDTTLTRLRAFYDARQLLVAKEIGERLREEIADATTH